MSRNIRFKLSGTQLEWALRFSTDLGMPLDHAAKLALIRTIREAYSLPDPTVPPTMQPLTVEPAAEAVTGAAIEAAPEAGAS